MCPFFAGVDVAYYLVHSMGAHGDYLEKDRIAVRNFGDAARRAGVRRIVYLGGLAAGDDALSKHLPEPDRERVMISVPLLTPRLSSLWLGLVSPVYARVGRQLIAGLKNRSVVTDPAALTVFPIGLSGLITGMRFFRCTP